MAQKIPQKVFHFVIPLTLGFLIQGLYGREISRVIQGFNSTLIQFEPKLSSDKLQKIRLYDRMKCYPALLCTLTKSGAFKKLGSIDLNELADGYIRLLSAFPGGPPLDVLTRDDDDFQKFKHDMGDFVNNYQDEQSRSSNIRNEDYEDDSNSEEEPERREEKEEGGDVRESEEMLLTDPLLHQKEKIEMKKLMDELIQEETAEAAKKSSTWTEAAMALPIKIPLKIGSTILNSVVLPYFTGDRKKRDLIAKEDQPTAQDRKSFERALADNENAITKAMKLWAGLRDTKQCSALYPNCPFQAWEVVKLIKLIN